MLAVNRDPKAPVVDPKGREFIRFVPSRNGQELVQQDGKYLPLRAAVVREGWLELD